MPLSIKCKLQCLLTCFLNHFCQINMRKARACFFILFRFGLESGILWWITAQFFRNLTVLAFDSPFPFGPQSLLSTFSTICLSTLDQLPMILILLLTLSSRIGSHQSSFCTTSEFHFFHHWHLSTFAWICPLKHLINLLSYPIVMTLWFFIIFSDSDQSVLHPNPLSYNNCCE